MSKSYKQWFVYNKITRKRTSNIIKVKRDARRFIISKDDEIGYLTRKDSMLESINPPDVIIDFTNGFDNLCKADKVDNMDCMIRGTRSRALTKSKTMVPEQSLW